MHSPKIQRALISVSNKDGLLEFATGLVSAQVEIYSTGGTRRRLEDAGIEVHDISAYTGFPEMMDGRIKTLHPAVHGGILCRHDRSEDLASLRQHGILTFELVVVSLYPFEATVAQPGVSTQEAIEQIDIGGPSLIRAAAKNHTFVTVATDARQYRAIIEQVQSEGQTTPQLRRQLAEAAFTRTAKYDHAISQYFLEVTDSDPFPPEFQVCLQREVVLRYGENPHQPAALYSLPGHHGANLVSARQLGGKELSYNNLLDLDSALAITCSLPGAAAVVVKHNNPCGAASAETLNVATRNAWECDPTSAFGSVLGFNRVVDVATAETLAEPGRFIEAIVAPDFDQEALEILTSKPKWKSSVRLLAVGSLDRATHHRQLRQIQGGFLVQEADRDQDPPDQWKVVTDNSPSPAQSTDLHFAWAVCRHVKSNAIALAHGKALVGVGAGQMSRVDAVEIALSKAGSRSQGAVLASDAFFPFDDSIQHAASSGVAAIIQPGGSRRDDEVIAACNQHDLPMVFTGRRHFKH